MKFLTIVLTSIVIIRNSPVLHVLRGGGVQQYSWKLLQLQIIITMAEYIPGLTANETEIMVFRLDS
ncbi:hypothetical protein PsorP6_013381 [Peronosclerospora sorghi]|uniref:Uncharacterized protein n=1 Tax=Peronosclerospora sorghi TaxID=230839 RepID=A0ACC0WGM7_9STRA|nr:hypothetical protein PsorP6_013381 [Peronosclerospora sorghi]